MWIAPAVVFPEEGQGGKGGYSQQRRGSKIYTYVLDN